jgi:hypothetical protein
MQDGAHDTSVSFQISLNSPLHGRVGRRRVRRRSGRGADGRGDEASSRQAVTARVRVGVRRLARGTGRLGGRLRSLLGGRGRSNLSRGGDTSGNVSGGVNRSARGSASGGALGSGLRGGVRRRGLNRAGLAGSRLASGLLLRVSRAHGGHMNTAAGLGLGQGLSLSALRGTGRGVNGVGAGDGASGGLVDGGGLIALGSGLDLLSTSRRSQGDVHSLLLGNGLLLRVAGALSGRLRNRRRSRRDLGRRLRRRSRSRNGHQVSVVVSRNLGDRGGGARTGLTLGLGGNHGVEGGREVRNGTDAGRLDSRQRRSLGRRSLGDTSRLHRVHSGRRGLALRGGGSLRDLRGRGRSLRSRVARGLARGGGRARNRGGLRRLRLGDRADRSRNSSDTSDNGGRRGLGRAIRDGRRAGSNGVGNGAVHRRGGESRRSSGRHVAAVAAIVLARLEVVGRLGQDSRRQSGNANSDRSELHDANRSKG